MDDQRHAVRVAPPSGATSHGGLSEAPGLAGTPERHPAAGAPGWRGRGRGRTLDMDGPQGPARAPLEPPRRGHQAAPPQVPSLVCVMLLAQRGAGWGPQIRGSLEDEGPAGPGAYKRNETIRGGAL